MTRLGAPDLAALARIGRDLGERADGELGSPAVLDAVLGLVSADGARFASDPDWGS